MKFHLVLFLCLLLIFVAPFSSVLAAEPQPSAALQQVHFEWGQRDGGMAADSSSKAGSRGFGNGFVGGLFLGPVGATAALLLTHGDRNVPSTYQAELESRTPPYQQGFAAGYAQSSSRKALTNCIIGGVVGTAVLSAIALAVISSEFRKGDIM